MPHAIGRERIPCRLREWRPVAAPDAAAALGDQRRDRTDAVGDEVTPREHVEHARDRPRRLDVDLDDVGVSVRRAHERDVGLAMLIPVFGVAALPGQQPHVLAALHREADTGLRHGSCRLRYHAARNARFTAAMRCSSRR